MGSASLKVNEPSMEEILASIRRIISDEQETALEPEAEEAVSSPLKTVLDLTERHVSPILPAEPKAKDGFSEGEGALPGHLFEADRSIRHLMSDYGVEAPARPAPVSKAASGRGAAQPDPVAPDAPLLSSETHACVADAFGRLATVVPPRQPQTVEDLMKEMLRPMLKAWLDDNLPALVERLVQAEIERVTRGRT